MEVPQDPTFLEGGSAVPDPRPARGKRPGWRRMLACSSAARVRGGRTPQASAQWVQRPAAAVRPLRCPPATRRPRASTLVRARRQLDVTALETHLTQMADQEPGSVQDGTLTCPKGERLDGLAVDGKAVGGTTQPGPPTQRVSLVRHGSGTTLAQMAVPHKRNEMTAVPVLLRGRDLTDPVITLDALLTQRKLARQIRRQHGP
jgi:hypothetical protein